MASLAIPSTGLSIASPSTPLQDVASTRYSQNRESQAQIMQLELDRGIIDDLIKAVRQGGKQPQLSFGKSVTLQYGAKSQDLEASPPSFPTFLYSQSTALISNSQAVLDGRVCHTLAMQKAQEELAGVDEALLKLQNSLASVKQAKESKQIKFYSDSSSLPPPVKQTMASLKQQSAKSGPLAKLKRDSRRLPSSDSVTDRSATLGSKKAGQQLEMSSQRHPRSAPSGEDHKAARMKAIRRSLIHLLACRSLSVKAIAQTLSCSQIEASEVLNKVARPARSNMSNWELQDRTHKDLNVWDFQYTNENDRDAAIDHSISALDRMRVSTSDPIWQKFLNPSQRGKGKTLSRLGSLQKGPIQQSRTPKIQVQSAESSKLLTLDSESETRPHARLANAGAKVRSKSQDSARIKVNGKGTSPRPDASMKPAKTAASGPIRRENKAVAKNESKKTGKYLSSEFVHDSDEDDPLEETLAEEHRASGGTCRNPAAEKEAVRADDVIKPREKVQKELKPETKGLEGARTSSKDSNAWAHMAKKHTPAPSKPKSEVPRKLEPHPSHQRPHSRSRSSTSPTKPSPLGSSPPENALSSGENEGDESSSASSTPLIALKSKTVNGLIRSNSKAPPSSNYSLKREHDDFGREFDTHYGGKQGEELRSGDWNLSKRSRVTELTPPFSDSPSPPSPRTIRAMAVEKAKRFKEIYPKYSTLHVEMEAMANPSLEQIDQLERWRIKLQKLKDQIYDDCVKLKGHDIGVH